MTYVNENTRLFLDETSYRPPMKRRSEGRLKTYRSTEDLRSWNYKREDRRQQILDVVTRDFDHCDGLLTRTVLKFFKDKHIDDLRRSCRIIWRFLNQLELSSEDRNKLRCLEINLGYFFKQVIAGCTCGGDVGLICSCSGKTELICHCDQVPCECNSNKRQSIPTGTYKVKVAGPVRLVTKVRGIKPGLEMPCESLVVKAQCCPSKIVRVIKNAYPDQPSCVCTDNVGKVVTLRTFGGRSSSSAGSGTTSSSTKSSPRACVRGCTKYVYSLYHTSKSEGNHLQTERTDDPIKQLQSALEERESLCEKQQANIECLKTERDNLNNRIQECLKELEHLKEMNENNHSENKDSVSSFIDEDFQRVKNELEALKKYCLQLRETETEYEKLKKERDVLKRQLDLLPTFSLVSLDDNQKFKEVTAERDILKTKVKSLEQLIRQSGSLPRDLEIYKDRSEMLDNTLAERDEMLKALNNMSEMQKELEILRKKAQCVDELENSIRALKQDKTSDYDLRRVKSRCLCLEKELSNIKMEKDSLQRRIDFLTNENESLKAKTKQGEVLKVERDRLQIKVNDLAHVQMHNENLRLKCKALENESSEGYLYRRKYEELLVMDCETQSYKVRAEAAEHLKRDRDSLKRQVSDLQSVISEQECEIRKLVTKAEGAAKHKDETQVRLREALTTMRDELEKKDSLIAASEEKLEKVQAELKSSIQGVSCETICYKTRLEELENELERARTEIQVLQMKLSENGFDGYKYPARVSRSEYDSIAAMKRELDAVKVENRKLQEIAKKMAALTGDEHVQKMLKHSESAIRKVVEELAKQYKEYDYLKRERRRSRSRSYDQTNCFQQTESVIIGDQYRSDPMQRNLQKLQNTGLCPGELIALKLRNTQLLEKLQKNYYGNEKT